MTLAITHATQATGTDAGNGEIHKAQWNEAHTLTGLLSAAQLDVADSFAFSGLGATTISANGASAAPPLRLTGTIFTGGGTTNTKPALLIEPSGTTSNNWNTNGTLLGLNAPSGF